MAIDLTARLPSVHLATFAGRVRRVNHFRGRPSVRPCRRVGPRVGVDAATSEVIDRGAAPKRHRCREPSAEELVVDHMVAGNDASSPRWSCSPLRSCPGSRAASSHRAKCVGP